MSFVFPLLNSPRVVISEVFNMLEFHELMTLSLCSKKTYLLIKLNWTKPEKLNVIMIRTCKNSAVGFNYGTISKFLSRIKGKRNKSDNLENLGTVEIAIHKDAYSKTYWNDEKQGLTTVTKHVCNLFKTDINKIVVGKDGLWVIDWINNSQKKPLPNAFIYQIETLSEEEYLKVLTECRVTDNLIIHAPVPESFRFDLNIPKVDSLVVIYGHWVTIDHLINMECKAIDIERTKITSLEMNKFVKNWYYNFGCPQLEYIHIETENSINCFDVLEGLEYVRLDEKQEFKMREGRIFTFFFSYDVKRSDGVTASINSERGNIAMFVKNN